MKITSKKIEKSWNNFQTHFRGVEMKIISGKYSLFYKDKPIVKDLSIREFYFVLESLRTFYLIYNPELIENFLKDIEDLRLKYK